MRQRQPYRPQVLRPEPVVKCATCGILSGAWRGVVARPEFGDALVCDRCMMEAARGARMDIDVDTDLPDLKKNPVQHWKPRR